MAIEGLDSLLDRVQAMTDGEIMHDVAVGVQQAAMVIRDEARGLCPVKTGDLRRSIHAYADQKGSEVHGGVTVGSEYGVYVEFGTGPRGEASHAGTSPDASPTYHPEGWTYKDEDGQYVHTRGQPAQPFLYPAARSMRDQALRLIQNALEGGG